MPIETDGKDDCQCPLCHIRRALMGAGKSKMQSGVLISDEELQGRIEAADKAGYARAYAEARASGWVAPPDAPLIAVPDLAATYRVVPCNCPDNGACKLDRARWTGTEKCQILRQI